jgi:hypothetical protein
MRLPSTALPGTPAGDEGGGIEGGGPEGGGIAGEAEVRQAASSGAANTTRRASVHATACRHPSKAVGAATTLRTALEAPALRTALEAPTSALGSRGRPQRTRSIRRTSTEGASRCSERTATRKASSTSRFCSRMAAEAGVAAAAAGVAAAAAAGAIECDGSSWQRSSRRKTSSSLGSACGSRGSTRLTRV